MPKGARKTIITGNWKMHKTIDESLSFIQSFLPTVKSASAEVFLAVPFTAIKPTVDALGESNLSVGAQNMNDADEGAFTGEIAAKMLKEAGATFVILGHSERRHIFGETNGFINKKVKRALADGLQPVLCVGETLEEREAGNAESVVSSQIEECLEGISKKDLGALILAYEPVWAIGTGLSATADDAQKMHSFCRKFFAKKYGKELADQLIIQYGGSVKPSNAKELMNQNDIDGLLVGGASLSSQSFSEIVNYES